MRNILRMTEASMPTPLPGSPVSEIAARKRRRRSRTCLRCRQVFRGDGPGERICLPCKESDEWYNDAEWVIYGDGDGVHAIAHGSATSFSVTGANVTAAYHAGRRVRAVGTLTGTIYGTIASSAFSTNTTVTITWDSGNLQNEVLTIYLGILSRNNSALPSNAARTDVSSTFTAPQTFNGTVTLGAALNTAAEVSLASAATTNIGAAASNNVLVTGTTAITSLGTANAGIRRSVRFAAALTLTHNGTSLILPGGTNIVTAANDTAEFLSLGAGNWVCKNYSRQSGQSLALSSFRGSIDGLTLSNNTTDANNDVDIAVGAATADNGSIVIVLDVPITKRLDATWTVGNGNGGLDTGTEAVSTWYHVWLIRRPDTGVADVLFSTSATAPSQPANYTQKRRIGAIFNDASSNIKGFIQVGDDYWWKSPVLDIDVTNQGTTRTNYTLTVPPGFRMLALLNAYPGNETTSQYFSCPDFDDLAPSSIAAPLSTMGASAGFWLALQGGLEVLTNTSRQIAVRSSGANQIVKVATKGWRDPRGKDQ